MAGAGPQDSRTDTIRACSLPLVESVHLSPDLDCSHVKEHAAVVSWRVRGWEVV